MKGKYIFNHIIQVLTLVWCSYFCYSASVRGSGGPTAFLGFNSTQSNYFMLKYSTDVYFISITSYTNNMVNISPFTFVINVIKITLMINLTGLFIATVTLWFIVLHVLKQMMEGGTCKQWVEQRDMTKTKSRSSIKQSS